MDCEVSSFLRRLFQRHPQPFTGGRPRSSKWPKVRAAHIAKNPNCEACGTTRDPEAHHIIPFHVQPRLELDSFNLMTLCGDDANNCHFVIGHGTDWKATNGNVKADAAYIRSMIERVRS